MEIQFGMNATASVLGSLFIRALPRCAVLVVALLFTTPGQTKAANVIDARSPSRADVGAAVALAKDGDTVNVPAGSATWTTTLNITYNIVFQGAGAASTIITNGITGGSSRPPLISISLARNLPFRMTGFTFKGGVATAETSNGEIRISGNSHSFRIDHCTFDRLFGTHLTTNGFLWGVIDHCQFNTASTHPITVGHATWNGKTYGNGSWADDAYWGSEKFVFIEDNIFENATDKSAIDAFEGARFVVRHNQFHNSGVTAHGTEGQGRGTKQIEEYNNSYIYDSGAGAQAQIRSGSLITFNNTSKRLTAGHVLQVYRPYHKSEHWGPVNGQNLYDQNDPKSVTGYWERGTHTGPTGSTKVVDSTKNWSANQWYSPGIVYMVRNITRETASTQSYTWAASNTSNTIVCDDLKFGNDPTVIFNPGDVYEIWKVDRALDQPGSGKSVLIPGLGNWPSTMQTMNQAGEPCYSWNNKDAVSGTELKLASSEPQIKEGRDFFNGTPKPSYTPFAYPHPLTGPAPPSNLQIAGP
jgi:hypothetical protein